jgi:acyl-CoA synthetase (NDP forming)
MLTDKDKLSRFKHFFNPRRLALIGASANPNKWGFRILVNILAGDFQGRVFPVNPRGGSLFGLEVHPSIAALPDGVDLAVITIPARQVAGALHELADKGIRSIIVISSGFSETGPEGVTYEKEISQIARGRGLSFIGPNTMGIFSAGPRLHALMPPIQPLPGGVSYVSQSGNLGVQMLGWGGERGVGFSKFASSGNEGDLQCEDYIDYFASDPETKLICGYIEGLDDGRRFLDIAGKATREKPFIIFKGGRTDAGGQAARSHSGALAGQYAIYNAAFRQAGIVEAETSDSLLDYAAAFLHHPLPRGKRVVILTRGGGWGVVGADACREWGLDLMPLPDRVIQKINKVLPVYWSHGNPIDMAATLSPEAFPACLEALIQEEDVDGIIALGLEFGKRTTVLADRLRDMNLLDDFDLKGDPDEFRDIRLTLELMEAYQKPVIMVSGVNSFTKAVTEKGRTGVLFSTPERAARAMAKLCEYSRYLQKLR